MRWVSAVAAAAALMTESAASARWREASSAHFVVYSEQSPDKLKRYAETLERYDSLLRLLAANAPRPATRASRVTVFLVSDLRELRRLFGARASNVAGFYIPRAETPVAFAPVADGGGGPTAATVLSSQRILLHEYAHHFMFLNAVGSYPAWYREGFAEFAGSTLFGDDGSVTIGGAAMDRAWGLRGGALSIADVVSGKGYSGAADADEFYARSWQLTHFLTFQPDRKGQLDRYLGAIAAGKPAPEAAVAAFGDLRKLERDARSYMSGRNIPATRLAASVLTPPPVTVRELSDGEDAALPVAMVSLRGVDPKAAAALVPEARAVAARFPADPAVNNMLAEAEIDANDYSAAIAAADRVLAVAPNDVHALVIRGRALMAQAVAAKVTDAARWKEVRRWFTTANRADRTDPSPLIHYYSSFPAAGETPSGNAVVALVEASRLAPQDGDVRAMLIRHYLGAGDLPQARVQLTLAGSNVHGRAAGRLAPVWAAVEANDAPGALAAFEKATAPPPAATKS